MDILPTVAFRRGAVELIDQTLLPAEYRTLRLETLEALCEAIVRLRIRGAPALGVAGAYGLLLAIEEKWRPERGYILDADEPRLGNLPRNLDLAEIRRCLDDAAKRLIATRPTAVNLGWSIERMREVAQREWADVAGLLAGLLGEARTIHREDVDMCMALGRHGAELLDDGDRVLTHCNTGGLATGGFGTALGVIFAAADSGKRIHVYADETRPLLQGARLTAWECTRQGVPVSVLCDGAAASLMSRGLVSCVIVGADRIAANGDTANKVGTLGLAIISKRYDVPFYVAAPSSTIDLAIPDGTAIPIEERSPEEVRRILGVAATPDDAGAVNPAFDVTPRELITAFITEKGIVSPPFV